MWISFPIGRRMRMGVPWWMLPVVIVVYAAAVMVWIVLLVITAPFWLILKLIQALTKPKPPSRVRPAVKPAEDDGVHIVITLDDSAKPDVDAVPPAPQRPGEIG